MGLADRSVLALARMVKLSPPGGGELGSTAELAFTSVGRTGTGHDAGTGTA
jgi:hypothetical protein